MASLEEKLATWAGIISTLVTIIGLVGSQPWLTLGSALCLVVSISAVVYARRERLILNAANIRIAGRSIDSLNLANLRRGVNRSLMVQEVSRIARIEGQDLKISSTYSGFCRAKRETAINFSVDSDNSIPFDELECWAYDLVSDPQRTHPIHPILQGTDGSSKKLSVPLLRPLAAHEHFSVQFECTLPGCIKAGIDYYTAVLSFEQDVVPLSTVRLIFTGDLPNWVRVYKILPGGIPQLLRDVPPSHEDADRREYLDVENRLPGQSAGVYVFRRAIQSPHQ
jgi:hypothetical protein